jgi:hypothetical protein
MIELLNWVAKAIILGLVVQMGFVSLDSWGLRIKITVVVTLWGCLFKSNIDIFLKGRPQGVAPEILI